MARSVIGVPFSVIRPEAGSSSRVSRLNSVDLPAPEAPTSAVVRPAGARKLTPFRTGRSS